MIRPHKYGQPEPFDLRPVVQQEVDGMRPLPHDHCMKLHLNVEGHNLNVDIDESKLRQVIINFIDNAIITHILTTLSRSI